MFYLHIFNCLIVNKHNHEEFLLGGKVCKHPKLKILKLVICDLRLVHSINVFSVY